MSGIYWLASYPKSGNTWLRIFLENYVRNAAEPVSINSLPSSAIAYRRELLDEQLGLETADLAPHAVNRYRPRFYEAMADSPDFRYVKTHECCHETDVGEPVFSRQATTGVVLLVRNPLDVAVSLADFMCISIDEAIGEMANEKLTLSPETNSLYEILPQLVSSWSRHTLSWQESDFHLLTVRYEDLLSEPHKVFADVVRFLKLPDDDTRLNRAVEFSDFRRLKSEESRQGFREIHTGTPAFFRQGGSGGWKESLTREQIRRIVSDHGNVMSRLGYDAFV